MKRPSFQFYPADWRNNSKLQRSSFAERGLWLEVMCLMHDSDEYGVLRWPLKDIARAVGCPTKALQKLVKKLIMKGADPGAEFPGFVHRPRHAGKEGDPVTLVDPQRGPIWFSSRMVLDEYLRQIRGGNGRYGTDEKGSPKVGFGGTPKPPLKATPKPTPKPPFGPGATSSSSSSSSSKDLDLGLSISPTRGQEVKVKGVLKKLPKDQTEQLERNRRIGIALANGNVKLAKAIKAGRA